MTRMPTRVRRSALSCKISRSAVCIRTIRSWSRSSGGGSGAVSVTRACFTGAGVAWWRATAARATERWAAPRQMRIGSRRFVRITSSWRSSFGGRAAEPEIAVPVLGGPGVPVGGARPDKEGAAGTAAHHASAGIFVVFVRHPLPDVAAHVEQAIRAGARRVLSHGDRMAGVLSRARTFAFERPPVRARAVDVVPPGVLAPVGPAGRLFPFDLRRKAPAGELAVGLGVVPVDPRDGKLGLGAVGGGLLGGRLAGTGRHAGGVFTAGHLGAID